MSDAAAEAPMGVVDVSGAEQEPLQPLRHGAVEEALAAKALRVGRRLVVAAAAAAAALLLSRQRLPLHEGPPAAAPRSGSAGGAGSRAAHLLEGIPGLSAADAEILRRYDLTVFSRGAGKPWSEHPEEMGALRTQCFIDPWQAIAYLGTAVGHIYRAEICPDDAPLGCTAPVDNTITALLWTGAFIATAASSCAETLNVGAACAAGLLKDLATSGSIVFGIEEDCFLTNVSDNQFRVFSGRPPGERRLRGAGSLRSLIRRRLKAGGLGEAEVDSFRKSVRRQMNVSENESLAEASEKYIRGARGHGLDERARVSATAGVAEDLEARAGKARTERSFSKAMCAFDSMNVAGWLIRASLWVRQAALRCEKPGLCAVDVLSILSSLSYASQFLNYIFVDCPEVGSRPALCGKDISETIGSLILFGPSVLKTVDFCALAMQGDEAEK